MASAELFVGWTTTGNRDDAARLARAAVELRLAACGQITGPIRSIYRWQGAVEEADEWRVTFKFLPAKRAALEAWLASSHPYDTPQWVWCEASASEKYLKWVHEGST